MHFYVYVHRRKTDKSIFYVGKGCGDRLTKYDNRNTHWRRIVAKHGFTADKVKDGMPEPCALAYERAMIAAIGMANLCNMTNGGDGVSGYRFTEEQRKDIGHKVSAAFTDEHREAIRSARVGKPPANAGMPVSPETRAKISAGNKGKKKPDGFGDKISAFFTGRKRPAHEVKAMSDRRKGLSLPQGTRDKISETMKGEKAHWYGKKFSEQHRENMSKAKIGIGVRAVIRSDKVCFPSAKDAAHAMRKLGYLKADPTGITATCKGRQTKAYGYGWQYAG